ncbi:MAG TPA: hypothetical protein VGP82_07860 [Ktedonobacterales bacterium]|nr:hypothetical protein [Ktedonobacterales bacterium]
MTILNLGELVTETTVEELVSGHGQFVVRLEPAYLQEALALVQQQPWSRGARVDESGALIAPAANGHGRDLNLFLVNAGFAPDSLMPEVHDLEQVVLNLTNSANGDTK